jgi:mannosyl-3-phosphoglycerate phosphatase
MIAVFTDLDGTLLDADTYSWDAAKPALALLAARGIPCIMVTSKTRAEVEELRERMANRDPFVVENGGAALIPMDGGYERLEFGTPYEQLTAALRKAAARAGCRVRAFHALSDGEVAESCGLTIGEARLARLREYDEPFEIVDKDRTDALFIALAHLGVRCTRGGRFYHVLGNNDKGVAVSALLARFRLLHPGVTAIGLGDSPNDVEFLRLMDVPVVVRARHDQTELVRLTGGELTPQSGPRGWNEAVIRLLQTIPD